VLRLILVYDYSQGVAEVGGTDEHVSTRM
jgi:hypothetical protein